jgi:transposase InsO family protein
MLVKQYINKGLTRDMVLSISGVTRHQLYYQPKEGKVGRSSSKVTKYKDNETQELLEKLNNEVVDEIIKIKSDPDQGSWYKLITASLKILGFYINHKKVYRLMNDYHLLEKAKRKTGRTFVKFRRVTPEGPLRVLEMDIKYVWIEGKARYGYILTVIDTFTRYVLQWKVGYSMRETQVKEIWDEIIVDYLQPANMLGKRIDIEVRNDNGKQFSSTMIQQYFKDNYLGQVFTHPYTPEENAHVERFHRTLGKSLKLEFFKSLEQVEQRLGRFYTTYNNIRTHGSIAMLSPSMYWTLYEDGQITTIHLSKKKVRFRLEIDYQDVRCWEDIDRHNYQVKKV